VYEQPHHSAKPRRTLTVLGIVTLLLLLVVSLRSGHFLLFHCVVEVFAVAVAVAVTMFAWNTRHYRQNDYLIFLGMVYAGVAALDLFHMLSYSGMNVIPGHDADLPTQLWISARALETIALLLAPAFLFVRLRITPTIAVLYCSIIAVLWMTISSDWLPACYIPGEGLTPFKCHAEYVIMAGLVGALALLWLLRAHFDRQVLLFLSASVLFTVASEATFTLYAQVDDMVNATGHLFKLASFVMLYWAIIHLGLSKPYLLIFRELNRSISKLEQVATRDALTGLYNRRGLLQLGQAQLALAQRLGVDVSVVFADLNGMKCINDQHGHRSGDKALRDTAQLLLRCTRDADILARVGGDEFVVVMVGGEGRSAATRLREAIEAHNALSKDPFSLSLALGSSRPPPPAACASRTSWPTPTPRCTPTSRSTTPPSVVFSAAEGLRP
jgi:diguanylate cyclase (GGDEF)-like protein